MQQVKILIVDREEEDFIRVRNILNGSFNRGEYAITWCNNYCEAINAMLKSYHDVYLVADTLGDYRGIDLLHEAIRSNCAEPVIILSNSSDIRSDQEALRSGAAQYLLKSSIDSASLERSIRYSLQQSKILKELRSSENKFRVMFERSKDPMLISDRYGHIYEANAAALSYFEITKETLLKSNSRDFYPDAEEREKFTVAMEEKGAVTDLELKLRLSNGKIKYCSVSAFLQISQHGNAEFYHTVIHDLTDRIHQVQELVIAEKLAVSERIARSFSNEIRNPLSSVNLALNEISANLNGHAKPVQAYLNIVKENCSRIDQLTAEFISSIAPKELDFKQTDIGRLLEQVIEEAKSRYMLHIDYTAQSFIADADETKLKQAVLNVIQNAAESLPPGSRSLLFEVNDAAGMLNISITDDGYGIMPENLTKVFEPFYTTKPHASGLGLTYARRIVHAHSGMLYIDSTVNKGTRVTLSVPLIQRVN